MTLSVIAALFEERLAGFKIFGIVKETGVDDAGLVEFQSTYFQYQLFCDKSYSFYRSLGDRKVGLSALWNPFSLFSIACEAFQRLKDKNVEGNLKGEGLVQGGIIFFGPDGKPKYVYEEATGKDLPVAELVAVLDAMRREPRAPCPS